MNAAKHTLVVEPTSYPGQFWVEGTSPGKTFEEARCAFSGYFGSHGPHLFAAAPDMLEALKYARRFLKEVDHDVAFVDAAIAKAEGRSDA